MSEVLLFCGLALSSQEAALALLKTHMDTSLTRKRTPLGPYRRSMPKVVGGSRGEGRFLMSEVPLYS